MEIKFNKDKTVTINATESEYNVIAAAIVTEYNLVSLNQPTMRNYYKPIVDAMNKAYNEQVAQRLDEGLYT